MHLHADLRLDKVAFNRWLGTQQLRHEWKEGRVVPKARATRAHARIVANILFALSDQIDTDHWSVLAAGLRIESEVFVRFPDALMEPLGGDLSACHSDRAILLFEVLSPSSVDTDMLEKPKEYMSFETLEAYVVASQDAALCWIWQRDPATGTFPEKPLKVAGRGQSLSFAARGIALPLVEIYRNIPTIDD